MNIFYSSFFTCILIFTSFSQEIQTVDVTVPYSYREFPVKLDIRDSLIIQFSNGIEIKLQKFSYLAERDNATNIVAYFKDNSFNEVYYRHSDNIKLNSFKILYGVHFS